MYQLLVLLIQANHLILKSIRCTLFDAEQVLHASLAAYVLRLLCYTALPLFSSPRVVMPVEVLHGITFAWSWAAGTTACQRLAPPALAATMQVRET